MIHRFRRENGTVPFAFSGENCLCCPVNGYKSRKQPEAASVKYLLPFLALAVAGAVAPANAAILYDASLGTTLNQQGWLYLTNPLFGAQSQVTFTGGATRLNSTATMNDSAGFFAYSSIHPNLPALDRQTGYTLQFSVAVPTETHASTNRAGFSALVVGSGHGSIELGFWTNEIWAQSGPNLLDPGEALFTHAESSGLVDTTGLASYELRVLGDGYSLWSDSTQLLSPDYSST